MLTKEAAQNLVKELKNWENVRQTKNEIISSLVDMYLNGSSKKRTIENAIVDNLLIVRSAEYHMKEIKARLNVR